MIKPQVLIRAVRTEREDRVDTNVFLSIPVYLTLGFDTYRIGEIDPNSPEPAGLEVAELLVAAAEEMRRLAAG